MPKIRLYIKYESFPDQFFHRALFQGPEPQIDDLSFFKLGGEISSPIAVVLNLFKLLHTDVCSM